MKNLLLLVAVGLSSVLLVGCTEQTNTHCPIMGGKIDGKTSTDWNGKTVGFCCPPCVDEWAEMTDEERQEALDEAAAEDHDEHGDHDHGDHEHADGDHDEHADHGDHDHGDHEHADGDHDEHGEHADHGEHEKENAPEAAGNNEAE